MIEEEVKVEQQEQPVKKELVEKGTFQMKSKFFDRLDRQDRHQGKKDTKINEESPP